MPLPTLGRPAGADATARVPPATVRGAPAGARPGEPGIMGGMDGVAGTGRETGGAEPPEGRSLLRSTLRALLVPRWLVPILLVCSVLVIAQDRLSRSPGAAPIGALMCLVFVLVAPVTWRALFPPSLPARATFTAPFGRLLVYGLAGAGTRVESGARVGPNAVLGADCVVSAGARLEGAILWDGVTVGPGAVLQDCIVGARVRIGANAQLGLTAVVEGDTAVPAGARL